MRATGWCGWATAPTNRMRGMQAALDHLMPYTQEFWTVSPGRSRRPCPAAPASTTRSLREAWDAEVDEALAEATLQRPQPGGYVPRGKEGLHSEHLGYVLAEMQGLAQAASRGPRGESPSRSARLARCWRSIPDPEIPVVSIRELGILREINERDGELEVVITPTYSGCPAMGQIEEDVRAALAANDLRRQGGDAAGAGLDHRLDQPTRPGRSCAPSASRRRTRCSRTNVVRFARPPASHARRRALPALRLGQHHRDLALQLHGLQGALQVPGLPRAVRLLQAY